MNQILQSSMNLKCSSRMVMKNILLRLHLHCISLQQFMNLSAALLFLLKGIIIKSCSMVERLTSASFLCSHERVLEVITEEAEKRNIERFQPLISGMQNSSIALRVCTYKQILSLSIIPIYVYVFVSFYQVDCGLQHLTNKLKIFLFRNELKKLT